MTEEFYKRDHLKVFGPKNRMFDKIAEKLVKHISKQAYYGMTENDRRKETR